MYTVSSSMMTSPFLKVSELLHAVSGRGKMMGFSHTSETVLRPTSTVRSLLLWHTTRMLSASAYFVDGHAYSYPVTATDGR